jgi:hypothetical protein
MKLVTAFTAVLLTACIAQAQKNTSVEGTWTGTSICLLRNSPCHDEQVVYRIARIGADSAGVTPLRVTMTKIVNGKEEDMADLAPCSFTNSTASLHCPMPPSAKPGDWKFTAAGDKLDGGLWVSGGTKFRDIHVKRVVTPLHQH